MINPHLEFQFNELKAMAEPDHTPRLEWKLNWTVPSELSYFNGHFPQNPILPAVAIIDATLEMIKKVSGKEILKLESVKKAKFLGLITPGLNLEIFLSNPKENHWKSRWITAEKLMAEIDLILSSQIPN